MQTPYIKIFDFTRICESTTLSGNMSQKSANIDRSEVGQDDGRRDKAPVTYRNRASARGTKTNFGSVLVRTLE